MRASLACGVPSVAFDIGGMPDIVRPGVNGYLAAPFSADELAQGIVSILESGEIYYRLSGAARQTVERDFSASLQAQRYEALYEEILRAQQLPAQLARC